MYVVAYVLIVLGALLSALNWGTLIASLRHKRFISPMPFVGALPLGCGLALLPQTRLLAGLALFADYGTLSLFIASPRIVYDVWSTSRINLVYYFTTTASDRLVVVKLFRRHIAVISAQFNPPIPCNNIGARVGSFGLVGRWSATETGFSIDGYGSDRQLLISMENGKYITAEVNYPSDRKYNYDSLDGLVMQKQKQK